MINKHIAGLKITTTNENNQSQTDIAQLWNDFFSGNNYESLKKHAKDKRLVVVYTNYESDFQKGNYDCYLGMETDSPIIAFASCQIDLQKYKSFDFPYYDPEDTLEARKTIWGNVELQRAYTADMEIYDNENHRLQIVISTL